MTRTLKIEPIVEFVGGVEDIIHHHEVVGISLSLVSHLELVEAVVASQQGVSIIFEVLVIGDQSFLEENEFLGHNSLQKVVPVEGEVKEGSTLAR